jgi:Tfp pilus assembly protein PilO
VFYNNNLLAIDWDKNHVRLLEFSKDRAGAVKIRHAVFESIPADVSVDDAENFGGFLKELIRTSGIRASAAVFMVGRQRSFLHQLTIPASPETEVANLARFQLAQELPFAIEESTVDYVITARNDKQQVIGVLAAAVQTEHIDFLKHLAKTAGVSIRRIGLRSYGNFLAARNCGYLGDGLNLFVDLSLHELEIDILSAEGGILFSRSAGLGEDRAQATSLESDFLDQAFLQLKRTLYAQIYLAGAPDARPKHILVAGSTGWEKDFLDRATAELKMTGQVFQIPAAESQHVTHDAAFVSAYGMACAQARPRYELFDFLFPKKAVDPQAVKARQIRTGIAVAAAVLILAFVFTQAKVSQKADELARLASKNSKLKSELSEFEKFRTQVENIQKWDDSKVNWLDELKFLTEYLPPTDKAYLKHMFVSESPKSGYVAEISIEGQAVSRQVIDQMAQELSDTGRYEVTPGQQVTMSRGDKYSENFKISLKVKKKKSSSAQSSAGAAEVKKKSDNTGKSAIEAES